MCAHSCTHFDKCKGGLPFLGGRFTDGGGSQEERNTLLQRICGFMDNRNRFIVVILFEVFSLAGASRVHVTRWAVSMVHATQTLVSVLVSCW